MNNQLCTVKNCDRPQLSQGICTAHYSRLRRHGSVMEDMPIGRPPVDVRFWVKVNKNGPVPATNTLAVGMGPCWLWTGCVSDLGYGYFRGASGTTVRAHRFAYELLIGEVPAGLEVDHLCRVRACVNPEHFEAVTRLENILRSRSVSTVNLLKTECLRGHEFTQSNTAVNKYGHRQCKTCANAMRRLRRHNQKIGAK